MVSLVSSSGQRRIFVQLNGEAAGQTVGDPRIESGGWG